MGAPTYRDDPKFKKALEQAKGFRQSTMEQLDNWKHANKVAQGQCAECLRQVILLQMRTYAWKDAVNSALALEKLDTTPRERTFAKAERGEALMHYDQGNPKPEVLAQAEAAFHDVLAAAPKERNIVFEEGRALAKLGRMDEAKAMFERYVDLVPASDGMRARAEHFAEDPHLATLTMAPPFRLVTSQGEELQLDDMHGKVVLLDFWATWCGPCKETLPAVASIARDYANDPMLVVISVSSDSSRETWSSFVQKNNMTWPQYLDANRALGLAYGVNGIPHFFTIDTNGTLKTEQVGSGADVRGVVDKLMKKAHKADAARAKQSDKAGQ